MPHMELGDDLSSPHLRPMAQVGLVLEVMVFSSIIFVLVQLDF